MRTRHAVFLLALLGGIGAVALSVASHRAQLNLELAQRLGGEEARVAVQASVRFGQMQELGFMALALIFLALFLLLISLRNEQSAMDKAQMAHATVQSSSELPRVISAPLPIAEPAEPEFDSVAPVVPAELSVVSPAEESVPPHA